MKRTLSLINLFFLPLLVLSSWADPVKGPEGPCDAPQIEWSYDTLCQTPTLMVGDTTVYDTLKRADGDCDSIVYIHEIHILPTYLIRLDLTIGLGDTSVWCGYRGGSECPEGIYVDSLITIDGCDSVQVYYITKAPTEGFCGAEGDGSNLRWSFDSDNFTLTITGSGRMIDFAEAESPWYSGQYRINKIILPDGLTSIGNNAFHSCSAFASIELPETLNSIGMNAFKRCSGLQLVVCHAATPPTLGEDAFYDISNRAILNVPVASIDAYKAITGYALRFFKIAGITSSVEEVTSSSASIKWHTDPDVTQYKVEVYKARDIIAYYVINSEGKITTSQRYAPSIHRMRKDTTTSTTEFIVLTMEDLEAGSEYSYNIVGTNASNVAVYREVGEFATPFAEGLDPVTNDQSPMTNKVIRDGQLFILKNGRAYTLTGIQVR